MPMRKKKKIQNDERSFGAGGKNENCAFLAKQDWHLLNERNVPLGSNHEGRAIMAVLWALQDGLLQSFTLQ